MGDYIMAELDRSLAVLLDMDGTLIDTEVVYLTSTLGALESLGFGDGTDLCHAMIGIPGQECEIMLRETYGPDFPMARFNKAFGAHRDEQMARGLSLKAGARELVEALVSTDCPRAIVTSASRQSAEKHLTLAGIRSYFDLVVTRNDVARGKPSPDLYLLATQTLGLNPGDCIAVEDSNPGVAAAVAAGVPVIMVPDILPPSTDTQRTTTSIMPDLHAVLGALRNSGTLPVA